MKYRVDGGTAVFGTDLVLVLSKQQAEPRMHRLERVKDVENGYRPVTPVQFKAGEILGIECKPDDLPGKLGQVLVATGENETVAKARPAAKRKAAAGKKTASKAA